MFNEQRCDPPKDQDEVSRIARDYAKREAGVERELVKERNRWEAKAILAAERVKQGYAVPTGTVAEDLAVGHEPVRYTVERLHVRGGNTLLVASYKTGKSTLLLNLARSLTDHEPFLDWDEFAVNDYGGRVGYLNYELIRPQFEEWVMKMGFQNLDRLCAWHLRGPRCRSGASPCAKTSSRGSSSGTSAS